MEWLGPTRSCHRHGTLGQISREDTTTVGLFTKVQPKPTNHSKFTDKCGKPRCTKCHLHPCCKSKDKTIGGRNLRSCDVSNHRLMTLRVVDGQNSNRLNNVNGLSATRILGQLGSETRESDDYYFVGVQEFVDDYGNLSFCDVGFVWDQVEGGEEEGWCLVAQL